jgi:hypothetical protein
MQFLTTILAMAFLATTSTLAAPGSLGRPSTSGTCSGTDNRCAGDITYWDGGLGACGWDVNSHTLNQIALPFEFMGTLSNSNPYCGKSVTIYNPATGNTAQATIGDKCMGCTDRSIDLTHQLFNQLTNNNETPGRFHNVQWWFN